MICATPTNGTGRNSVGVHFRFFVYTNHAHVYRACARYMNPFLCARKPQSHEHLRRERARGGDQAVVSSVIITDSVLITDIPPHTHKDAESGKNVECSKRLWRMQRTLRLLWFLEWICITRHGGGHADCGNVPRTS